MRIRHPFALPLGALILVALTPEMVGACHWWGHKRPVYRPVYAAPAPVYVAAPMHYAPPMHFAPAPGTSAPRRPGGPQAGSLWLRKTPHSDFKYSTRSLTSASESFSRKWES